MLPLVPACRAGEGMTGTCLCGQGRRRPGGHFVPLSSRPFSWQHFQWLLQHPSSKNSAVVGKLVPPQRTLPRMQPRQERLEQPHVSPGGSGVHALQPLVSLLTDTSPLGLTSPLMPMSPLLETSPSLSQSPFQSHHLQKGIFVKL